MADFASIVRPFASIDTGYPRRIINSDATPPANVVLRVGDNGGLKTLAWSYSYSLSTYMQKRQQEVEAPPDQIPDGRKRHVKRHPGKTRNKSTGAVTKVPGTWIDVERYETITTQEGSGIDYQKTKTKFEWYLDDKGEVPNPSRKTRILEIPADKDNPDDLFFEIEINDAILVTDADQKITRRFDNGEDNSRRGDDVEIRRIPHFGTPHDDDPELEDGGIIRDYQKTPNTKDASQYLDVEIPGSFAFDDYQTNRHVAPTYEHWQRTVVKLNNDYLITDSDVPDKSYGGAINPPVRFDPLQNIRNVNLGLSVIVVIAEFGPAATAEILEDKATFLRLFTSSAFNPGLPDATCRAYKVSATAGEFLRTVANINGEQYAVVFAMDGDTDESLERAIANIQPVLTAIYLNDTGADPASVGLPNDIAAPGVLWVAGMFRMSPGHPITWKIRYENHRDAKSPTPPNNRMVQCYPLTAPYTTADQLFFGYIIFTYRLDRRGTEIAYGSHRAISTAMPARVNGLMPPPWFAVISDQGPEGIRGILFGDPPPIVATDNPSV